MGKRIWHKTYFLTLGLFMLAFFLCIFIIDVSSLVATKKAVASAADGEALAIKSVIETAFSGIEPEQRARMAEIFTRFYQKRGVGLAVMDGGNQILSNELPDGIPPAMSATSATLRFARIGKERYAVVSEPLSDGAVMTVAKPVTGAFSAFLRQTLLLTALSTAFTMLLGTGLYFTLLRINRPVDNLAHELRTPLTTIRGYAEYLKTANVSIEERYESLQYIIDESARLSAIAEKLLTMANLRAGSLERERVPVINLFQTAAKTFPGKVSYEETSLSVTGDQTLLQSLVTNLVANAVKAGGTARLIAEGREIAVADDGCGMTPERLASANRRDAGSSGGGSGLGIPLCHEICALHNAELHFDSVAGEGTVARITFTGST